MPSSAAVNIAPLWAATWRPSIPVAGMQIMPADLALVAMVAGRWAEYEPCPCADEPGATLDHLRRMRDEGEVDPLAVASLSVGDINATLGWRSPDAIAGMLVRARHMTNGGEPLYRGVEVAGDIVHFHVASGRAMVPAHRRLAPMMRGRGTRGLLSDHSYASLEPGMMARFVSALSAPVYARARSWLHAPGDAGLPKSGVDLSDDGHVLRMTVPAGDVMHRLGLWGRDRPSVVDGIVQLVALDLARVDLHVSVTYEATRGRRADTAHISLSNVPFAERPVPVDADALGISRPDEPWVGRHVRVSAKAKRDAATAAAASVAVPVETVPAPSPAKPRRMRTTLAPLPTVEPVEPPQDLAPVTPLPEPAPAPTAEPVAAPAAPVIVATVDAVAGPVAAEAGQDGYDDEDDEPVQPREPHDGWGWVRNEDHDGELTGGSEELAHLDEYPDGYDDWDEPAPHEPALPLPGDVYSGPRTGDERPHWLVRHLRYHVSWLEGGWADRPMSAHQATALGAWQPTALWLPGLGAQPAHVRRVADVLAVVTYAMRRRSWRDIRSRLDSGETEERSVTLGLDMATIGYAALDAEFGAPDAEPWDADREDPDMSPRDAYYTGLVRARHVAANRERREGGAKGAPVAA